MATTHSESRVLDVAKRFPVDTVMLRRGEGGLTTIDATIMDNNTPFDLTGCSVLFYAWNAKKEYMYENVSIKTPKEGKVSYTVSTKLTGTAGDVQLAYFRISSGTKIVTTQRIPIIVLDNVDLSGEEAEEYESQFEKLLADIEDLIAQTNTALDQNRTATAAANKAAQDADTANSNFTKAESTRVSNENTRKSNETTRQSNETTRKSNETSRQTNETTRQNQESARVTAEEKRVEEFNQMKQDTKEATDDAKAAADNANEAAGKVDQSIQDAEEATDRANKAADQVDKSVENAVKAAGEANSAASASRAATDRVNAAMETYNSIVSTEIRYANGESATTPPTTGWTAAPQATPQGQFLWCRTVTHYYNGSQDTTYSISHQGKDGRDGVTTEINGLFWIYTDEASNLWVLYSDENNPPEFEYDKETGNLYKLYEI